MKPHSESQIADKFKMAAITDKYHVTKHFKMMMFFNWCVQMHVYSTDRYSQANSHEIFEPLTYSLHSMTADNLFATQYDSG